MNMKYFLPFLLVALVLPLLPACAGGGTGGSVSPYTLEDSGDSPFESADLSLLELIHRVKRVEKTTFYNVIHRADSLVIDTAVANRLQTTIYFDSLGNYVQRRDERIERDDLGRIVRWEDRRPNHYRLHGGFLKDTLGYHHVSANVVESDGMGDFAVTVYDDRHRIVGQYTDPLIDGEHTAVFNIYREDDDRGNWTERLSVWTTQSAGGRPHISYTLDRRKIIYYN